LLTRTEIGPASFSIAATALFIEFSSHTSSASALQPAASSSFSDPTLRAVA